MKTFQTLGQTLMVADVPLLNLADYAHCQGQPWARKTSGK